MKKIALALGASVAVMAAAGAAHAEVTTTGSIAGLSDYRLRGVSLSNMTPVMQGSIEVAADLAPNLKAFAGVWASSLDKEVQNGAIEVDLYAGLSGKVSDIDLKGTYLRLKYPDYSGLDFDQYAFSASKPLGPTSGTLGLVVDDIGSQNSFYYYANVGMPIAGTPISVSATLGYEDGDFYKDKINWGLGATATYKKLKVGLEYIGSDTTVLNPSGKDRAGDTVVLSVSGGF